MIFRIVWILRIIAVCLIVFFVLDYLLKWNTGREILIISIPFFLVYVIMSMIAAFVRFRIAGRVPPPPKSDLPLAQRNNKKTAPDKAPSQEDEKVS